MIVLRARNDASVNLSNAPVVGAPAVVGPVLSAVVGVDARDALATSVFGSPGVYAFLAGSGLSSAAGVLTGERIIEDLIRRVARSTGEDPGRFDDDPRGWWRDRTGQEPRYDELLKTLAPPCVPG